MERGEPLFEQQESKEDQKERLGAIAGTYKEKTKDRWWGLVGGKAFGGNFATMAIEYDSMFRSRKVDDRDQEEMRAIADYLEQAIADMDKYPGGDNHNRDGYEALSAKEHGALRVMLQRMAEVQNAKNPEKAFFVDYSATSKGMGEGGEGKRTYPVFVQTAELLKALRQDIRAGGATEKQIDAAIDLLENPHMQPGQGYSDGGNYDAIRKLGEPLPLKIQDDDKEPRIDAPEWAALWLRQQPYFRDSEDKTNVE